MSDIRKEDSASQIPDSHVPLESMPNILETVPPPLEHQDTRNGSHEPQRRGKVLGFVAGGLTLAGVGLGVGLLVGGEDSPSEAASIAVDETVPSTETTAPEETTPSTTVEETGRELVTVNGLELAIPNGETPEEIMDVIAFNREQVANFVDFADDEEQQLFNEEFITYVAYEPGDEFTLQELEVWRNAQNYKLGDAFVEYEIAFSDIEVIHQTADLLQVEATMTDGSSGPVRKQITLRLGEIDTPNGPESAWLIKYETFA